MCDLVARTGRHQQRYEAGCRLVAGYIPFFFHFLFHHIYICICTYLCDACMYVCSMRVLVWLTLIDVQWLLFCFFVWKSFSDGAMYWKSVLVTTLWLTVEWSVISYLLIFLFLFFCMVVFCGFYLIFFFNGGVGGDMWIGKRVCGCLIWSIKNISFWPNWSLTRSEHREMWAGKEGVWLYDL